MTLPLVSPPQLLSSDDVFGFRLANRRINVLTDQIDALGREHTASIYEAGEHNSTQIAKAVCVFRMPHHDPESPHFGADMSGAGRYYNIPLRPMGPSKGWLLAPRLVSDNIGTTSVTKDIFFIECAPYGHMVGVGFTACMETGPTWTADQMFAVSPRRTFQRVIENGSYVSLGGATVPRRDKGARIYLGSWDAVETLVGGTIVCNVEVYKEV